MTKKHFVALADAIVAHNLHATGDPGTEPAFTYGQVQTLADFCEAQNDNFNRERWLGYLAGTCGKNGGKR